MKREKRTLSRIVLVLLSIGSLGFCLASPILYFLGKVSLPIYKAQLLGATAAWFLCAAALAFRKK